MKTYQNHDIEQFFYDMGYTNIAGCDEAGRGPLVGPVVAGAVIMPKDCFIDGVTDSKKLSDKRRRELEPIIKEKAIAWAVSFVSEKEIDEINIYEASKKAMMLSLRDLKVGPDLVVTDAMPFSFSCPVKPFIHGDALFFSIACASILAKVARDNYMIELGKEYPMYQYEKNKGYPTPSHLKAIETYGVTNHYRFTFGPVKKVIQRNKINI